jgi:MFS family permease
MSYDTFANHEDRQPNALLLEERAGWCHMAKIVTFIGGVYIFCFVATNFTIFSSERIRSDIPGMTKVALGTCQSLFWIGWMAASGLIMPHLDAFGRKKPTFVLLGLAMGVVALLTSATTVVSFGAGMFFLVLLYPTAMLNSAIWMQESVPSSQRSTILVAVNVGYAAGSVFMAISCMYTREWSWRNEARLWFSPLLVLLVIGPFMTVDPPKDGTTVDQDDTKFVAQLRSLFFSSLWRNTVATLVCWIACAASFYGLSYSAGNISDDLYTNMALFGLVDVVSYFLPLPIMNAIGKIEAQTMGFVGTCVALLCCVLAPRKSMAAVGFAMVGRFFINISFTTIYVLIVDCFPEERRASAIGMANLFGRLGSTAAPYAGLLPFQVTSVILSAATAAAGVATRCLEVSVAGKTALPP